MRWGGGGKHREGAKKGADREKEREREGEGERGSACTVTHKTTCRPHHNVNGDAPPTIASQRPSCRDLEDLGWRREAEGRGEGGGSVTK